MFGNIMHEAAHQEIVRRNDRSNREGWKYAQRNEKQINLFSLFKGFMTKPKVVNDCVTPCCA
jgi:hypothetical protein